MVVKSVKRWMHLPSLQFVCWSPDPQDLRMWLHFVGGLKEVVKIKWGREDCPYYSLTIPICQEDIRMWEHTQTARRGRFSKYYYKTTRYIDFTSTVNLNTYTLIHILHIHLLCTLAIHILIYTYTCTNRYDLIVLCRCCTFWKLRFVATMGCQMTASSFFSNKMLLS